MPGLPGGPFGNPWGDLGTMGMAAHGMGTFLVDLVHYKLLLDGFDAATCFFFFFFPGSFAIRQIDSE